MITQYLIIFLSCFFVKPFAVMNLHFYAGERLLFSSFSGRLFAQVQKPGLPRLRLTPPNKRLAAFVCLRHRYTPCRIKKRTLLCFLPRHQMKKTDSLKIMKIRVIICSMNKPKGLILSASGWRKIFTSASTRTIPPRCLRCSPRSRR